MHTFRECIGLEEPSCNLQIQEWEYITSINEETIREDRFGVCLSVDIAIRIHLRFDKNAEDYREYSRSQEVHAGIAFYAILNAVPSNLFRAVLVVNTEALLVTCIDELVKQRLVEAGHGTFVSMAYMYLLKRRTCGYHQSRNPLE